jgi:pimeloyl-ACP methyl ester carboxylesterase
MKKTIIQWRNQLVIVILSLLAFACQDQEFNELSEKNAQNLNSQDLRFGYHRKTYVLVHGAWHPESSWHEVKWLLERSGHIVKTVQLPGLGDDATPVETVTFQDHVNAVKNVVASQSGQVILVGHSYGGAVVSQAGEELPHKIKKLIYVNGFMPADGETIGQWALADTASLVTQNLIIDGAVAYLTTENYGKALYNVALQGNPFMVRQARKIISELRPHPVATLFAPLHLTSNYQGLEKVYISCHKDRAVTPAAQQSMYNRFPGLKLYIIKKADHSPFVSAPLELVDLLKR